MPTHHMTTCSCGTILAQCRCPSPIKTTKTLAQACIACKSTKVIEHPVKGTFTTTTVLPAISSTAFTSTTLQSNTTADRDQ